MAPVPTTLLRRGRTFELWRANLDPESPHDPVRGCLLVRPTDVSSTRARERLAMAVSAHRAIDARHVARVLSADLDGAMPHAVFDVDAVADGEEVVARLSARGRIPFAAAIGFIDAYVSSLARAHDTRHPTTGTACCLAAVGWGAFVFDATGDFALLGFGSPLGLDVFPPSPGAFVAPEVGAGAAATPGADVLAFALLHRSSLGLVALPERLESALFSLPAPSDLHLVAWLARTNRRLFVGPASKRPSVTEALDLLRRSWKRLGVEPEPDRFRSLAATTLRDPLATTLHVAGDAAWFAIADGERRSLARRAPLRRVLAALVRSSEVEPMRALSVGELFLAGWPGERIRSGSSAGRVYVAVSTLRRFGLADVIERFEDGYRLSPTVNVRT